MPVADPTPDPPVTHLSTRPPAREIAASIACALLAFLITASVLHAAIVAIRPPLRLHADVRSEKLVMLDRWRGQVFSAAFGTSHMHNGFDPRAFDAGLAGTPAATRSANLAVEGGSQSEQFAMAQEFLRQLQPPAAPQPCLVLLELTAGSNFTLDHLVHPRAINVYDWPTTQLITRFTDAQMPARQRFGRTGYALTAMGLHYANVGMLSNEIFAPPLSDEVLTQQTADDRRGLMAMPPRPDRLGWLNGILNGEPRTPRITSVPLVPGNAEMISRLAAIAPARNISFAYVVMPKIEDFAAAPDFPDHITAAGPHGNIEVPIINLARPDRFPQLYNPQLWFDDAHLTSVGAPIASRLLAQQLARWYATHGGPAPCA